MLAVQAQQHALGTADHHSFHEQVVIDAPRVVRRASLTASRWLVAA